jgi:uncharacterized protein YebE (UPF0316 family)
MHPLAIRHLIQLSLLLDILEQVGRLFRQLTPGLDWSLIPSHLVPLVIFCLRTSDITLATLRMLIVVRGRKTAAWFIALAQATLFVVGVAGVLGNLNNPLNILAYAAGFASGNVVGILIEARLAPGHSLLRITSSHLGDAVSERLHALGYGATVLPGTGIEGTVSVILCYVPRRDAARVRREILEIEPEAFITLENVRQLRGGWRA